MTEIFPAQVEQKILELSNRIARSAGECDKRYQALKEAERVYEQAYANAYVRAECPQTEKKYRAVLATVAEREALDVADAAYRYADRLAKSLQSELMAYQTVNRSVLATYSVAGVGER